MFLAEIIVKIHTKSLLHIIVMHTWVMNIYGIMQVKILNLYIINTRIYIHDKKVRAYVAAGVLFSK